MTSELTIETEELIGLEAEIRDVNAEAMRLRARDPKAALHWLNQHEHLVESVSVTRQGRFYNQRALALKDIGEYDRAILEFDRAAMCFETSGETELRGMVYNNIARAYSLAGNYTRAHESIDAAIRLTTNPEYLVQWGDQRANIYCDEGKLALAEVESDKALALLVAEKQFHLLAECLSTKRRIASQNIYDCAHKGNVVLSASTSLGFTPSDSSRGGDVLLTPVEYAQLIIQQNYVAAEPLFNLIALVADPDGNPDRYATAWAVLQFLFVRTPRGEREFQSVIEEVQDKPQELSEVSS